MSLSTLTKIERALQKWCDEEKTLPRDTEGSWIWWGGQCWRIKSIRERERERREKEKKELEEVHNPYRIPTHRPLNWDMGGSWRWDNKYKRWWWKKSIKEMERERKREREKERRRVDFIRWRRKQFLHLYGCRCPILLQWCEGHIKRQQQQKRNPTP